MTTNPTGSLTAQQEPAADPALAAPESYVADAAEIWREIARMIGMGLPAPFEVHVSSYRPVLTLRFQASSAVDAWGAFLPDELSSGRPFTTESHVTTWSWRYEAWGTWLGRAVVLEMLRELPTDDQLVERAGGAS